MIVFDIETDGLLPEVSKVHCLNMIDRDDGKRLRFNGGRYSDGTKARRDGTIEEGLAYLQTHRAIAGANIIKYDEAVLAKLYGWSPTGPSFDTRVASAVIWPDLRDRDFAALRKGELPEEFLKKGLVGVNSVEAWGYRLDPKGTRGFRKGDSGVVDNDWTLFTKQMDDYCEQDNEVTLAWIEKIESKNYSPECLSLEMRVAEIIAEQERHGVGFNVPAAEALYRDLTKKKLELEHSLQSIFEPWEVVTKTFIAKVNNKKLGRKKGDKVVVKKTVIFNPGSTAHIADRLQAVRGWRPTEFTAGGKKGVGKPKVTDEILSTLPYPEAGPISEYLGITKVLGMLGDGNADSAWLKAVTPEGRIHGSVNTAGAVTGRMTHSRPNLAQVPKVGSPFGSECRSLFIAIKGVLVGCDAEGLELRILAHYMAPYDGGAYARAVVDGKKEDGTDVHTVNQRGAGLNKRDSAKTFIYALLYGAGDFKLGTIVYDDFTDAQKASFNAKKGDRDRNLATLGKARRARLMGSLPALEKVLSAIKARAKARGYLRGLDGRLLHIRSEHAAPNTLFQSGGAVVMKKALVLLHDAIANTPELAGRAAFVLNIHDEFELETDPEIAEQVGQLAADSIRLAGEHFDLKCPLSGSFAVGPTWKEVH